MIPTRSVLPWMVAFLAALAFAGCTPVPYYGDTIVLVPVPEPPHCPPPGPGPHPHPNPPAPAPGPEPTQVVDQLPSRGTPATPTTGSGVTKTQDRDAVATRGPVRVDHTGGTSTPSRTPTRNDGGRGGTTAPRGGTKTETRTR